MKKILVSLLVFCLWLMSHVVHAAGGINAGLVTLVMFYDGHAGVLIQHTNMADPDSCGRKDYFILPNTHPHFREAYALLLSAHSAGKKARFTLSGCHDGIPAIKHIFSVAP